MERIASFKVDHTKLQPGMYVSRRDGFVTTFDLRFKIPNSGDLLSNAEMHSAEHLFATLLRNSDLKKGVLYFGPMGCQTGFYLLVDSRVISDAAAIELMRRVCREGSYFDGQMPGKSAEECGNYKNLSISLAKKCCSNYLSVIRDWTERDLNY